MLKFTKLAMRYIKTDKCTELNFRIFIYNIFVKLSHGESVIVYFFATFISHDNYL